MSKQISSADLLWFTAECTQQLATKLGVDVGILDVYTKDTVKQLALAGGCFRQVLESALNEKIEVTEK